MELSAKEQLIAIAKEKFNITYGLRFTISDEMPYTKRQIGKYSVKVYDETPAGELILRRIGIEAAQDVLGAQERFIWSKSAELFNEFPDCFESFDEAKDCLVGTVTEKASKTPQCMIYIQEISRESISFYQQLTEELRLINDLIFCFFLSLHIEGEEWELENIYSLGQETGEKLREFYTEVLGLKSDPEAEPEDITTDEAQQTEKVTPTGKSRGQKS